MKEIRTILVCSHCFKESPVKIKYLHDSMFEISCERCGQKIRIYSKPEQILFSSLKEWGERALTKPIRIAIEAKRDSIQFMSTFPFRLLTKPLRIVQEVKKTLV